MADGEPNAEMAAALAASIQTEEARQTAKDERYAGLQSKLTPMGFRIDRIRGDGNCLFAAVGVQLQPPKSAAIVRQEVVDRMRNRNANINVSANLRPGQNRQQYLNVMARNGTYGGEPELHAIERLYGRPIEIYQSSITSGAVEQLPWRQSNRPLPGGEPIRLFYTQEGRGSHYDALIPIASTPAVESAVDIIPVADEPQVEIGSKEVEPAVVVAAGPTIIDTPVNLTSPPPPVSDEELAAAAAALLLEAGSTAAAHDSGLIRGVPVARTVPSSAVATPAPAVRAPAPAVGAPTREQLAQQILGTQQQLLGALTSGAKAAGKAIAGMRSVVGRAFQRPTVTPGVVRATPPPPPTRRPAAIVAPPGYTPPALPTDLPAEAAADLTRLRSAGPTPRPRITSSPRVSPLTPSAPEEEEPEVTAVAAVEGEEVAAAVEAEAEAEAAPRPAVGVPAWVPAGLISPKDVTPACRDRDFLTADCAAKGVLADIQVADEFQRTARLLKRDDPLKERYTKLSTELAQLEESSDPEDLPKRAELREILAAEFPDQQILVRRPGGNDVDVLTVPNPYRALAYREKDPAGRPNFANPAGVPSEFDPDGSMASANAAVLAALAPQEMIADHGMAVALLESLWACGRNPSVSNDPRCIPARVLGELREWEANRRALAVADTVAKRLLKRSDWPLLKTWIWGLMNAARGTTKLYPIPPREPDVVAEAEEEAAEGEGDGEGDEEEVAHDTAAAVEEDEAEAEVEAPAARPIMTSALKPHLPLLVPAPPGGVTTRRRMDPLQSLPILPLGGARLQPLLPAPLRL